MRYFWHNGYNYQGFLTDTPIFDDFMVIIFNGHLSSRAFLFSFPETREYRYLFKGWVIISTFIFIMFELYKFHNKVFLYLNKYLRLIIHRSAILDVKLLKICDTFDSLMMMIWVIQYMDQGHNKKVNVFSFLWDKRYRETQKRTKAYLYVYCWAKNILLL